VRQTVIRAVLLVGAATLAWGAPPPAAETYRRDLASDRPSVRRQAAAALGRLGDRAAVNALAETLADADAGVRQAAARALGHLKDRRATPALVQALDDPDRTVRFYAAYALGEVRDPRAGDALVAALADPAWTVRDQAAWALRALADPPLAGRVAEALRAGKADADHALWLLRHLGGRGAVGHLASLLEAEDAGLRLRAVRAMAETKAPAAVDPLLRALDDSAASVRRAAVEALADLGDDRAREALARLATRVPDPALRDAAEKAVLRLAMHEDLMAWWSFDAGEGTTARDVTGGGADGEIKGCRRVDGRHGRALDFRDGAYVELGKPPSVPVGGVPLTLMAWVKPRGRTGVVVARGGGFCGFSLYLKGGTPRFGIHRVEDGPAYIAAADETVGEGWVHLAGVVREDRIELFVDGKRVAAAKTKGYLPGNCGQPMEIGFDVGNTAAEITDAFDGLIDEVKVYRAALAGEAIAKESRVGQP
jgi:HEAT repeat protein